jgi:alanyl-tRNA synthetase
MGALMFFGDKYGDRVNVVEFGDFSREFCGGTHVHATQDIGYFKFKSEGSVASGVRRIEAVTASHALELMQIQDRSASERFEYASGQLQELRDLASTLAIQSGGPQADVERTIAILESSVDALKSRPAMPQSFSVNLRPHFDERARREISIETLILEIADMRKSVEKDLSKSRLLSQSGVIDGLVAGAQLIDGIRLVSAKVETGSLDELKSLGDMLRSKLEHGVGLLAAVADGKVSLVCVVTDDLVAAKKLQAGKIVGSVAKLLGGGGGGKAHLATAGGKDASKLSEALASTGSIVHTMLDQS